MHLLFLKKTWQVLDISKINRIICDISGILARNGLIRKFTYV